ncbi:amnion associated transmembrane protein isoform X2 [Tachypleus tridentatus]|uniref:amnion associated transmembrane protein isoform X2 n=1 Tax=Tachypleus tridentatus TaxID=6853 RepID=UPI003FD26510
MYLFFCYHVFLFSSSVGESYSSSTMKTWILNNNFNNPNNWNTKRNPCSKDRVVFPAHENVVVYIPGSLKFRTMVLPMNGQFVLGTSAVISLSEGSVSAASPPCEGQDVQFEGLKGNWFDPPNWNVSSSSAINIAGGSYPSPIPHSEQVPCPMDNVVFPVDKSFKVSVKTQTGEIKVNSIIINGMVYDNNNSFSTFIRSPTGKRLFDSDNSLLTVEKNDCSDSTSCACGNDRRDILLVICAFRTPQCPTLQCSDPIQPIGHCCQICGSSLLMTYGADFKFNPVKQLFTGHLTKPQNLEVQGYISKTHDNKIQMIFVDGKSSYGKAAQLAHEFESSFQKEMFGVTSVVMKRSVQWNSGIFPSAHKSELSGGGVAGVIIALLILVALAASVYFIYKKRRIPGFAFARFESERGRVELELGTTPHEVLDPAELVSSSGKHSTSFVNPMFESSAASFYGKDEPEEFKTPEGEQNGLENPMYLVDNGVETMKQQ